MDILISAKNNRNSTYIIDISFYLKDSFFHIYNDTLEFDANTIDREIYLFYQMMQVDSDSLESSSEEEFLPQETVIDLIINYISIRLEHIVVIKGLFLFVPNITIIFSDNEIGEYLTETMRSDLSDRCWNSNICVKL